MAQDWAIPHATPDEVETYGGQPNKQAADLVTTFDPGRMIWNGYTGAAGWMFRQAFEGVLGYRLDRGAVVAPVGPAPDGLGPAEVRRALGSVGPIAGPVSDLPHQPTAS